MTEAVVTALERELAEAEQEQADPVAIARAAAARFRAKCRPGGRLMTKNEIDEMWGHEPDELG